MKTIKTELKSFKKSELSALIAVLVFIAVNAIVFKDSKIAVLSSVCGIMYTVLAGKGKFYCYLFGLCGSGAYSFLSWQSMLYGNLVLYMFYYIPMQVWGLFQWKNNLKKDTTDIIKTTLTKKQRITLIILTTIATAVTTIVLHYLKDSNPLIDATTTVLSVVGMYLTVKRCFEQWIVWMIVNFLSLLMWLNVAIHGTKVYATVIMWAVYLFLAVYFYFEWKKELKTRV